MKLKKKDIPRMLENEDATDDSRTVNMLIEQLPEETDYITLTLIHFIGRLYGRLEALEKRCS